jgi:hypothetical protein
MASRREARQQEKREKHKKKREQAQRARAATATARPGAWPLSEAWISQNWHERGATVHGALTRTHATGRVAAAVFTVDLAERGVVDVQKLVNVHPAEFQAELMRRSADLNQLQVCEPELVARMIQDARSFGAANGHAQPRDLDAALELFPDVDPSRSRHAPHLGDPAAPVGEEAPATGLWASLKRRVGLG